MEHSCQREFTLPLIMTRGSFAFTERVLYGFDECYQITGLGNDSAYTVGGGHRVRFGLQVLRGVEEHWDPPACRLGPDRLRELAAVHAGHHNVGQHQVQMLAPEQRQRFGAVTCLDGVVPAGSEHRADQIPVDRSIVNHEHCRHAAAFR